MKSVLTTLVITFGLIHFGNSQTISPLETSEFCPEQEVVFTVTVTGTNPTVVSWTNTPTLVLGAYNIIYNSTTGITTFNFKGRFRDVNIAQSFKVTYTSGGQVEKIFTFKNIKSLFYPRPLSSSCPGIQPNQSSITAPQCQITNIPISFNTVKWSIYGENPVYCFGNITTYEYKLPAGWVLNGTTSNGSNWITGSNNVTVISDLNTGGVILVRPSNNCGSNMQNGENIVQIGISRPAGFTITPTNISITCGSTTPVTFTVNNVYNVSGVTNHTWNLGTAPNGWLYNGIPAPQTILTGMVNTLTLTPVCGVSQSNVGATITVNANNCTATSSSVSLTLPTLSIIGNDILCSGTTDFVINNVPCNASVSWSVSPSGIVSLSPNGGTVTLTKIGNGTATITATINTCGTLVLNKDIIAGAPVPDAGGGIYQFSGGAPCVGGGPFWYELVGPAPGYVSYEWIVYAPSQTTSYPNQPPHIELSFNESGTHTIAAIPYNSCGGGAATTLIVDVASWCGWGFSASPNPAESNIEVALDESTLRNDASMTMKEVRINDKIGNTIRQVKNGAGVKRQVINISQLKPGLYYIRVFNGKEWKSKSIIKQ